MKLEKIASILIIISSLALSVVFFVFQNYFRTAETLGLASLFVINFLSSATLFISAPSLFAVISAGSIYPALLVAVASSTGSALGDMLGFVFGLSGRTLVIHKLNKKIWFIILSDFFKKHGWFLIFIFAFVPNPFFDSIGIIAGAFSYSPKKFFILVLIGRFVRNYLLARFGAIF
ncbi:MAG: VTT domain-containing protein [Patescibacteria group bacterium]|nr:VTT domain-containing protein [Patescibacteria group bacterium]